MHAFVVDANAISEFQHERASDISGFAIPGMEHILSHGYIAVDDNAGHPIIIHEWLSCASHANSQFALDAWITDQMQKGKIKLFPLVNNNKLRTDLRRFGVAGRDGLYIKLACSIPAHSIVSNDIDLHDPTEKRANPARRLKIMKGKTGVVCRYLSSDYSVRTLDWEEVITSVP